jgi:hypothetical protein
MCSELGLGIIVIPMVGLLANVAIAKAFGKTGKWLFSYYTLLVN